MSVFRIVVADDHPVFRFGLCSFLGSQVGWHVCGEAVDGRDAAEKCRQLRPDLLVLDIGMPRLNGLDAARQILKDNPTQRILVLTDVDSEDVMRDCVRAGVRGWVCKSESTGDLKSAVEALQRHKCIFSSRVSRLIFDEYQQREGPPPALANGSTLSPREREVVQLVGEGRSTKQVAAVLNVTVKTAESHRSNIMRKLNLHSVAEWVLYAVRNGIVEVNGPAETQTVGRRETAARA